MAVYIPTPLPSPPQHFKLSSSFFLILIAMGNCIGANKPAPLPSDAVFVLPSPLPTWPSGNILLINLCFFFLVNKLVFNVCA